MNIKDITDQVFSYLDETVLPQVIELFSSNKFTAEKKQLELEEPNVHKNMAQKALLQKRQNAEIAQLSGSLLRTALSKILQEAAFWFKADARPENELQWVVSPFEYHLMAPATVSVALQQADELLMGIWCDLSNAKITTAELGGGSWQANQELTVRKEKLSKTSQSMQFTFRREDGSRRKYGSEAVYQLKKEYEFTSMANDLDEQMANHIIYVASGKLDFTVGNDFSYPDIAAAISIVEQAGGLVTDFSGGKEKLYAGEEFFASNKIIHEQFMDVVKGDRGIN